LVIDACAELIRSLKRAAPVCDSCESVAGQNPYKSKSQPIGGSIESMIVATVRSRSNEGAMTIRVRLADDHSMLRECLAALLEVHAHIGGSARRTIGDRPYKA
jgi:hypothetical protein